MKKLLGIQSGVCILGAILVFYINARQCAASYAMGSALILINLIFLTWVWSNILKKKFIALSVSLIVLKYALLGIVIYKIISDRETDLAWFSVGLGSLIISILLFALGKI